MRCLACILLALIVAVPALAADLPPDAAAFTARRERCDHFRGEDPENPARAAAVARGLQAHCRGMDAELAHLKRRYAHNRAIRTRLDALDPLVE
jgi:hypothetical protein